MSNHRKKVFVNIFLRGGMDGLMAVTPFTDPKLPMLRPKSTLPHPGSNKEGALLDLDCEFGLNPSLAPLHSFYKEGRLAVIHGVGSVDTNRSHFEQQEYLELGTPGNKRTRDGWLNRALAMMESNDGSPFRAVATTPALPRALYGEEAALAIPDLATFGMKVPGADGVVTAARGGLESLYQSASGSLLGSAGTKGFSAMKMLAEVSTGSSGPANGAIYPDKFPIGENLRQIAKIIKSDVGLTIAWAEAPNGDWDNHTNHSGMFNFQSIRLAQSLEAFYADLGNLADDVVVLVMTEFGRTVAENGSGGTDHGRATCYFLLGREVAGGRVYGNIPILDPDALDDGRDLPVTTDFRAVLAEIAPSHLGVTDTARLFPGWNGSRMRLFR